MTERTVRPIFNSRVDAKASTMAAGISMLLVCAWMGPSINGATSDLSDSIKNTMSPKQILTKQTKALEHHILLAVDDKRDDSPGEETATTSNADNRVVENTPSTISGEEQVTQTQKTGAAKPKSSPTDFTTAQKPKPTVVALVEEVEEAEETDDEMVSPDDDDDTEDTLDTDEDIADFQADEDDDTTALPVAEDVDLSDPVVVHPATIDALSPADPENTTLPVTDKSNAPLKLPLILLGEEVIPGTSVRLSWSPDQNFAGIATPTPVLVVNGTSPGKTLCLTAAVHGDELNGIEIVRRVMYDLDPSALKGAVIGIPIVNLQGFRRNSRYLPDRRDLNRFFPGSAHGSSASRIAHSFFTQIIGQCDALVDIHTGSFLRTNLPQLRADMTVPEVAQLTEGFGATAVLHSVATAGTLRHAAVAAGVPSVTLETGEPSRLQEKEIEHGTKGVQTLLTKLKMTRRVRVWGEPEPVYYQSIWVRADHGGLLFNNVKLGQRVRKHQLLGTITDPITNVRVEVRSPEKGRILGMALNQVVMPGFASFRIGIPSTEAEVAQPDPNKQPPPLPDSQPSIDPATPASDETSPQLESEDENS